MGSTAGARGALVCARKVSTVRGGRSSSASRAVAEPKDGGEGAAVDPGLLAAALERLERDPEAAQRLRALKDAMEAVESKERALEALQNAKARIAAEDAAAAQARLKQEGDAAALAAAATEVETAAAQVAAARAALDEAAAERDAARAAAGLAGGKWAAAGVDEEAEKLESAKAAVCGAVGAAAAALPYAAASGQDGLAFLAGTGGAVFSGALFGLVYRYAVRRDLGNGQLKSGVIGAFGLTRGLGAAGAALSAPGADASAVLVSALDTAESLVGFFFAAAAMELAFRQGVVKPFGVASGMGIDE